MLIFEKKQACAILAFANYGREIKITGQIKSRKPFSKRLYYSDIRLRDEEFEEMAENYKKEFDTFNVLTKDIIADVKNLSGGHPGLTSMCLEIITKTFPAKYDAKTPSEVQALIATGILDYCLASDGCPAIPRIEELIEDYHIKKNIIYRNAWSFN